MTTEQATNYGTLIGVCLVAVAAQWNAWKAKQTAKSVKQDLQTSNDTHAERLNVIHDLVNGGMEQQLKNVAALTRRIADITRAPEDLAAYENANKQLVEHQQKQANASAAASASASAVKRDAAIPGSDYVGVT